MIDSPDDIIDATLLILHNTPPPTGLEDRLLQTLEVARQRVPHVSTLRRGWTANHVSPRLWMPASVAAAAALAVALFLLHPTPAHVISTEGALLRRSGEIPALPVAQGASTTQQPTQSPINPNPSVILSEARRSRRIPTLSTNLSGSDLSTSKPDLAPTDQALANTLAPSQPAPPLPLTQQERLLLLCTRRGQPIEVANLDPNQPGPYQAANEARERDLQRYIKGLLNTLVDFQPTDPTPSQDETKPPPDPPAPTQQPTSRN